MNKTLKKLKGLFITTCLLSFSLPSCNSEENKTILIDKIENIDKTVYISTKDELNSICRYDNALIYVSLPYCSYCEEQRDYLKDIIKKNQLLIYEVSRNTYLEAYEASENSTGSYAYLYPKLTTYPSYLLYSEGKLINSNVGILGSSATEIENNLFSWITPSCEYIINDLTEGEAFDVSYYQFISSEENEELKSFNTLGYTTYNLDSLIEDKSKKTVLFSWRRCNDCKNLRNYVLDDFYRKNLDKKIYKYEVDGYFLLKRNDDENFKKIGLKMYSDFSNKYHLSDYPNIDIYSNTSGYVPTFVTYNNDSYSLSVFANESEIKLNDENKIYYSKAFYDEIKKITSSSKVASLDEYATDYKKALSELNSKVLEKDIELNKKYLELTIKNSSKN